jgi:hypothetical protein
LTTKRAVQRSREGALCDAVITHIVACRHLKICSLDFITATRHDLYENTGRKKLRS